MTAYPPINPNGKPPCWPQQHNEQIAGLCDACGQHTRLYPIAEGPLCGPAAICADCIWALTPRDPYLDQPLFAIAQRENEGRCQSRPIVPLRVSAPARLLGPPTEISQRPELVCERQLSFDFSTRSTEQPQPPQKAAPQTPNGTQSPVSSIARSENVQSGSDPAIANTINSEDGITCDGCGRLIRIYLENAVVNRSGERCCLDCFEARHNLEPFIVTATWLNEHGAELDQDWRFVHDVAELFPNGAP